MAKRFIFFALALIAGTSFGQDAPKDCEYLVEGNLKTIKSGGSVCADDKAYYYCNNGVLYGRACVGQCQNNGGQVQCVDDSDNQPPSSSTRIG
ncbi:hypothetical protein BX667DRAFT_504287 [Coemansia mojavensis]|nr:hypothetical protein BX667DRAFT_504287 [Coemansia mojavensis]